MAGPSADLRYNLSYKRPYIQLRNHSDDLKQPFQPSVVGVYDPDQVYGQ
jgi:hypothetical protein